MPVSADHLGRLRRYLDELPPGGFYQKATLDLLGRWSDPAAPTSGCIIHPSQSLCLAMTGRLAHLLDKKAIIILPNRYVADRAMQILMENGIDADDIGVYHSQLTSSEKASALQKKFLVLPPSSFVHLTENGRISASPGDPTYRQFVFFAGANRGKGDRAIRPALQPFLDKATVIGFAGTEEMLDGFTVSERVFGQQRAIHQSTVQQAADRGEIAPVKTLVLEGTAAPGFKITADRPLTHKQEGRIISPQVTRKAIIQMHGNYVDSDSGMAFRNLSALVVCTTREDARDTAKELNAAFGEEKAVVLSSETSEADKKRLLTEIEAGKRQFVVTPELVLHGLNAPRLSVCYVKDPTSSPERAFEGGARVIERDPGNADKFAHVVSCTHARFPNLATFAEIVDVALAGRTQPRGVGSRTDPETTLEVQPKESLPVVTVEGLNVICRVQDVKAFVDRQFVGRRLMREARTARIPITPADQEEFTRLLRVLSNSSRDYEYILEKESILKRRLHKVRAAKHVEAVVDEYKSLNLPWHNWLNVEDMVKRPACKGNREKLTEIFNEADAYIKTHPHHRFVVVQGLPFDRRFFQIRHGNVRINGRVVEEFEKLLAMSSEEVWKNRKANELLADPDIDLLRYDLMVVRFINESKELLLGGDRSYAPNAEKCFQALSDFAQDKCRHEMLNYEMLLEFRENSPYARLSTASLPRSKVSLLHPINPGLKYVTTGDWVSTGRLYSQASRIHPKFARLEPPVQQAIFNTLNGICEEIEKQMLFAPQGAGDIHIEGSVPLDRNLFRMVKLDDRHLPTLFMHQSMCRHLVPIIQKRTGLADQWQASVEMQESRTSKEQRRFK